MPTSKPRRRTRRTFTKEFKLQVLRELDAGSTIAELARIHDVHPETIRVWSKMERKYGAKSFAGRGRAYTDEARIAHLERALGQATLEISLLKKVFGVVQGDRSAERRKAMIAIAHEHRHLLSLTKIAKLFKMSRSHFYGDDAPDRDVALRDGIYAITIDWPLYGYRTVTHELRGRGFVVNEKRVRRIMRAEGLVCRRRSARGLPYRKHGLPSFPNLTAGLTPTGINQLWVTDFTYVRLFGAFVFVAIVLDAYSRMHRLVVGNAFPNLADDRCIADGAPAPKARPWTHSSLRSRRIVQRR